ncbi:MAG: lipopolysaccharide assembly protein LapA domain-containing protein [Thermomonas sp.]|uniref:lipopolysaccharide assembly protein LapA domain-containing protein n=1 Tax=Thermomonas sp. TaxID=1971895 RepID=UPI0039E4034C
MARLLRIIAAVACILLGAVVGALNTQPVALDLGFTALHTSLGLAVLLALLLGVLVGGILLALGVVAPLRRKLGKAEAAARQHRTGA